MSLVDYDNSDDSNLEEPSSSDSQKAMDEYESQKRKFLSFGEVQFEKGSVENLNNLVSSTTAENASDSEITKNINENSDSNEEFSNKHFRNDKLCLTELRPKINAAERNINADTPEMSDEFTESQSDVPLKKKAQPVKIVVPAVSLFEDEPSPKRPKPSCAGSGLFASLPPPKNTSGKIFNRSLIPHSLTKKQENKDEKPIKSMEKSKQVSQPNQTRLIPYARHDDSDEDDDDIKTSSNFFSFDTDSSSSKQEPLKDINTEMTSSTSSFLTTPSSQDFTVKPDISDSPLTFQDNWAKEINQNSDQQQVAYDPNIYPSNFAENQDDMYYSHVDSSTNYDQPSSSLGLNDEVLRRLQGKRKQTHEEINIIDVSQDDQLPRPEEWMTKSLTEEKEYHTSRKKEYLPTTQQRRKHQITYLAFQAKERELQLKNQWAHNRLTKRQTQAKYGF